MSEIREAGMDEGVFTLGGTCIWERTDDKDWYRTSCFESVEVSDDSIEYRYCPHCGGHIVHLS